MAEPESLPDRRSQVVPLAGLGGSGGGNGGMLDQRVASLEIDMREVKGIVGRIEGILDRFEARFDRIDAKLDRFDERLRKVEIDVAETKGRVSQLPTAWAMLTGGVGLIVATYGFSFALVRFALPH